MQNSDPYIDLATRAMDEMVIAITPGTHMVDLIPACRSFDSTNPLILTSVVKYVPSWMPGAGFKKTAEAFRETAHELINKPYNMVKEQMVRFLCWIPHLLTHYSGCWHGAIVVHIYAYRGT
jgi:hypothetical protein